MRLEAGGVVVEYLDDLVHFCSRDDTVTIQVKHSENFTHHFFWSSIIHDVEDNHELSEVNVATAVGVVYSGKRSINLQSVSDKRSLQNLNTCFSIFVASFFGRAFCII